MASTVERPYARLDKRALFNLLGYAPHRAQHVVHDSRARIRVLACGARFGKSLCSVMELVAFAVAPGPSTRAWIAGPRFEVVDLLLELLLAQLRGGLAHRLREVDRRARRLVIRNLAGNDVIVEGRCTANVASMLGEAVDFLLIDEAGRVADHAWEGALSQRLIERNGSGLIVGTPRREHSWFHGLYLLGQGSNPDVESWSAPTIANPAIDPSFVERERERLSPAEYASEYEGLFVGPHGPLCSTCNGPNATCQTTLILLLGEEIQHCRSCARPLNREGQPVGVMHGNETYVLRITTDSVTPPE
jgi:hypothetical protein